MAIGFGRHVQPPPSGDLPSMRRLLILSALALVGLAFVAVAIVLPAERGKDPTGFGRFTGLEMMGRIKLELAMDAADHEEADRLGRAEDSLTLIAARSDTAAATRTDETRIGIAPHDSSEAYLIMTRGAAVFFAWDSATGPLSVVVFGDSLNGRRESRHRYRSDQAQRSDKGELVAAFDGFHGWRWYNPGDSVVTLVLRTSGRYVGGRQSSSAQ
jgi:hypothetical protein